MVKLREEFNINLSLDDSLALCRRVVEANGYVVREETETGFICRGKFPSLTIRLFGAPGKLATANISASPLRDQTTVVLETSIFGIGPWNDSILLKKSRILREGIVLAADTENAAADAQPPDSLVSELERLARLHTDAVLSDEEFLEAKSKVLGHNT